MAYRVVRIDTGRAGSHRIDAPDETMLGVLSLPAGTDAAVRFGNSDSAIPLAALSAWCQCAPFGRVVVSWAAAPGGELVLILASGVDATLRPLVGAGGGNPGGGDPGGGDPGGGDPGGGDPGGEDPGGAGLRRTETGLIALYDFSAMPDGPLAGWSEPTPGVAYSRQAIELWGVKQDTRAFADVFSVRGGALCALPMKISDYPVDPENPDSFYPAAVGDYFLFPNDLAARGDVVAQVRGRLQTADKPDATVFGPVVGYSEVGSDVCFTRALMLGGGDLGYSTRWDSVFPQFSAAKQSVNDWTPLPEWVRMKLVQYQPDEVQYGTVGVMYVENAFMLTENVFYADWVGTVPDGTTIPPGKIGVMITQNMAPDWDYPDLTGAISELAVYAKNYVTVRGLPAGAVVEIRDATDNRVGESQPATEGEETRTALNGNMCPIPALVVVTRTGEVLARIEPAGGIWGGDAYEFTP